MVEPRRRNFLAITAKILETCRTGAKRTHIMYHANLSFRQLNKYVDLLETRVLVRYDSGSRVFRITERGRDFLLDYNELEDASKAYNSKRKSLLRMLEREKAAT